MTNVNTSGVTMQPMPKNVTSAMALANASMIVAGVVKGLAGKSIADSLNGSPVMLQQLSQVACSRIVQRLNERVENARKQQLAGYNR